MDGQGQQDAVPRKADVAIVGAGYAGLSCALELAQNGQSVVVLDRDPPGAGASTRSGGQVTGGVNVGKVPSGGAGSMLWQQRQKALLTEASQAYDLFEALLHKHGIECGYHKNGRITGAWTNAHLESWRDKLSDLNALTGAGAFIMSRQQMREEIATELYAGGIFIQRAGYIDPALYYGGLLRATRSAGAVICGEAEVQQVQQQGGRFVLRTARGTLTVGKVVVATNGATGNLVPDLQRRVVPVVSHQIATEELPEDLARSLLPHRRAVAETRRVMNYYRLSSDGRRLLFGGRARFYSLDAKQSARVLHRQLVQRFPQLADVKVSHSWSGHVGLTFDFLPHVSVNSGMHYALGCNGSGVTMMTYLGYRLARALLGGVVIGASAYDSDAPTHMLYRGTPWFMPLLGTAYQLRDAMDLYAQHRRASSPADASPLA